ncbi:MAG: aspartate-semialdehyde dehydrogenase [Vicinamibacterales bacterium]
MSRPYRAAILGATGAVGQKFVRLLAAHPWFSVSAVVASERSAGKTYAEATRWLEACHMPDEVASLRVASLADSVDADVVFSALDAPLAREYEPRFAAHTAVVSNASAFRSHPAVPLVVPEVNADHLSLLERQTFGAGCLVTVPNCSSVGLAAALGPLDRAFGLTCVHVTTLQAVSGAGYPGVPSLDILGNVIPFIPGEEDKIEREPLEILGRLGTEGVEPLRARISAQVHRVPVVDGHVLAVSAGFRTRADPRAVLDAWRGFESGLPDGLPSAPPRFLEVFDRDEWPQPRLHAGLGGGMTVSVGRARACRVLDVRFSVLVHNTVRGAAGNAVLIAELLARTGRLRVPRLATTTV